MSTHTLNHHSAYAAAAACLSQDPTLWEARTCALDLSDIEPIDVYDWTLAPALGLFSSRKAAAEFCERNAAQEWESIQGDLSEDERGECPTPRWEEKGEDGTSEFCLEQVDLIWRIQPVNVLG